MQTVAKILGFVVAAKAITLQLHAMNKEDLEIDNQIDANGDVVDNTTRDDMFDPNAFDSDF